MAGELAKYAKDNGVKFFLFNFTDLFGSDLAMLDARLQRFMAGLK